MTPESQRIAVAEACGWRRHFSAMQPKGETEPRWWISRRGQVVRQPPNYLGDLNACHEMEDSLTVNEWTPYLDWLEKICVPVHICPTSHGLAMVMAPASQRAEAFLRTKGLWVEG